MAGTIEQLTFAEYRARPGLNASTIAKGRTSMLHMRHEATRTKDHRTAAMRWGTLIHSIVLEPVEFAKLAKIIDTPSKRHGEWLRAVEDHGDFAITPTEHAKLIEIKGRIHGNRIAQHWLSETTHEASLFWAEPIIGPCKARLDAVSESFGLWDLKSTGQIEMRQFGNTSARLGYHVKLGWYRRAFRAVFGKEPPQIGVLAFEADEPYDVVPLPVSVGDVAAGEEIAVRIALEYADCCERGEWPGVYRPGLTLNFPDYIAEELDGNEAPEWDGTETEPEWMKEQD